MRIRSLLVNGTRYRVRYLDHVVVQDEVCDGVCDDTKKVIHINAKATDKRKRVLIMHELIHAVVKEFRIRIELSQEEKLAEALSETMEGCFEITRKGQRYKD